MVILKLYFCYLVWTLGILERLGKFVRSATLYLKKTNCIFIKSLSTRGLSYWMQSGRDGHFFFFLHPREGSICHFLLNFFLREGSICHFLLKGHLKGFGRLKDTICIYCLPEAGDIVTVCFVFISHCCSSGRSRISHGGAVDLHFENFACQNKRILTCRGGMCWVHWALTSANVLI